MTNLTGPVFNMALSEGVLPPDHEYCEAVKQIKTMADFSKWEGSEAYEVLYCVFLAAALSLEVVCSVSFFSRNTWASSRL